MEHASSCCCDLTHCCLRFIKLLILFVVRLQFEYVVLLMQKTVKQSLSFLNFKFKYAITLENVCDGSTIRCKLFCTETCADISNIDLHFVVSQLNSGVVSLLWIVNDLDCDLELISCSSRIDNFNYEGIFT